MDDEVADVRTCAEELLYLLGAHGVDVLFLNPGTDSAPVQEAAATLRARGVPFPRLVTSSFEAVALAAAHGYWQVTRRPQALWVHVDAGTQNLGAMVHNVLRDRAGVLVLAGKTPYAEDGETPGGRNSAIHWQQDVPDQAGIVRSYAKWTAELARSEDTARVVGRALQVAAGGVPGLAYLTLSRDILMEPPGPAHLRRVDRWARPHPPGLSPGALGEIADLLAGAHRPLIVTSRVGRTPGAAEALARLAGVAAIPVIGRPEAVNIPSDHPQSRLHPAESAELLAQADVIVIVECDVPWIPSRTALAPDATIVQIDPDPVHASMPLWTYPLDLSVTADGATALAQLADALEARRAEGSAAWEERRRALAAGRAGSAPAGGTGPLTGADIARVVAEAIEPGDLLVEEAVTNAGPIGGTIPRPHPGTLFSAGGPGLGWSLGASVGIRLAAPDRRVVTLVGDGAFMFGVPTAALCLAAEAEAPFLALVLDNDGYRASRLPVFELFPEGPSAASREAVGTRFRQPPDFAAVARACGAFGETVDGEPALRDALKRGLAALDHGQAGVIDVRMARD